MTNLKRAFFSILALTAASAANAADLANVTGTPPLPSIAATADWSGFYAGIQAGTVQETDLSFVQNGNPLPGSIPIEGPLIGGFAGYNIQRGNFVFGGEAVYSFGTLDDPNNAHNVHSESLMDLKARMGFARGSALFYGFAGYSSSDIDFVPAPASISIESSGLNYGVGIDIQAQNGIFVGIDYTVRNLAGTFDPIPGVEAVIDANSLNIRVGKQF